MPRRLAATMLAGLALAGSGAAGAADMTEQRRRPPRSTELPLPHDGDIAVRAELEAARRAGTLAAYDLFLRRQGKHPLAEAARRERAAIAAAQGPRP